MAGENYNVAVVFIMLVLMIAVPTFLTSAGSTRRWDVTLPRHFYLLHPQSLSLDEMESGDWAGTMASTKREMETVIKREVADMKNKLDELLNARPSNATTSPAIMTASAPETPQMRRR
jgi:hypothetical protein